MRHCMMLEAFTNIDVAFRTEFSYMPGYVLNLH